MRPRHVERTVATLLLAWSSVAFAQPANDDCANATVISAASLPFSELVDTSTATNDGDVSAGGSCGATDHSVWYRFTAGASDVRLVVDVFDGSTYVETDPDLFTGSCGALVFAPQSGAYVPAGENLVKTVPAGESVLLCVADGDGTSGGPVRVTILEAPEFLVTGDGYVMDNSRADVAGNSSGEFFVAWGDGASTLGRLFDAAGTPLSSESVLGAPSEAYVSAATMGSDEFVAAWWSAFATNDVLVRRIDASGTPAGSVVTANTASDARGDPAIAGNASGFVVVWPGGTNANGRGPTGRLFDTSGAPLTGELTLAAATTALPGDVSVGMDAAGNFVVVWKEVTTNAIVARHFDAAGTALGAEFVVEQGGVSYYAYPQFPDVDVAPGGHFLVVWEDASQPGDDDKAIIARAYEAGSSAGGALLQVNQQTLGRQHEPRVAADADGNFVVVWEDDGGRAGYGYIDIAARRVDATGASLGDEFSVATVNGGYQYLPNVGGSASGEFMVVWNDDDNAYVWGSGSAVVARGFAADAFLVTECPSTVASGCRGTILPGKSKLLVRNDGLDPEDLAINWKLVKAEATAATDFGDPTASDDLFFCLYDDGGALVTQAAIPAAGLCAGKPCWKGLGTPAGSKGFKYKDVERTPNGVLKAILKPGDAGKTKVVFKAGRGNLATGPAGGPPAVPITGSLTAQLHAPATGTCWGASFDAATAKRNSAGIFQGSGD
jgi:hypothetical protein